MNFGIIYICRSIVRVNFSIDSKYSKNKSAKILLFARKKKKKKNGHPNMDFLTKPKWGPKWDPKWAKFSGKV